MNDAIQRHQAMLRAELPMLADRFDVESLGLFGSRLRGDARTDSDLDILVSFSKTPSLFRLVELENHLSDLLAVKVDLAVRNSLKPHVSARILREVVPV